MGFKRPKACAGGGLALGFEVEQFAGYTVAVDFIAAIGNRCFQLGHTGVVDGRLIAQLVSDLLQLLSLIAEMYRFPACDGTGLFGGVVSGADLPASAVSLATLVRVLPVSDEELFKRLKSMTMIKKPLGIWTLAMFSAIPAKTLGSFKQ